LPRNISCLLLFIKNIRKEVVTKLRFIQEQTIRRIIDIYKTIFTKVLQDKINVFFINIYLKKLIQRSIVIINAQKFEKIIDVTILRIRNNLILKKEQKLKLKIIFLQLKKKYQ
jgi:hypothetical protein